VIEPTIINVICPQCKRTWMNRSEESGEYFCCACAFTMTEEQAKKEAWKSKSPYYGE
jgi:uncharacterized Zn finger protein (UPF0148 family)